MCDVCIRKELGADVVLSCGTGNTFQSVLNSDVSLWLLCLSCDWEFTYTS